ncbi:hypothetical protein I4641_12090 [Waterburya agarophytonicola K14]|uniref:Uncharacterized protein n=1 Tax=Waterburya agarophytonicola KI4 TaxID=2874699 RepID=A0A964BQR5_9CYAN|nr:hypothetical protein [Waterburya agarophytonicola]MCC0177720.1 hypothetical protein [Waterburya agarophytonicola KI4]
MTINKSLSFPQAIEATQSLMNKINAGKLDETNIEKEVSSIVSTKNGGRGFFVTYLTSDMLLADRPSLGTINGLKSSIEIVSELLVKNLAMSSAMAIAHARNGDLDNVRGSQKVYRRTSNLIQQIKLDQIDQELEKLKTTISTGKGYYDDFIERWGYDVEQQEAIQKAIVDTLV